MATSGAMPAAAPVKPQEPTTEPCRDDDPAAVPEKAQDPLAVPDRRLGTSTHSTS